MAKRLLAVLSIIGILGACAVGPDYRRPVIDTPSQFQTGTGTPVSQAGNEWWKIFHDATLESLIDEALKNSYDLRAAMERVSEAQAQANLTRSEGVPNIDATAGVDRTKNSERGSQPLPAGSPREQTNYDVRLRASYELDLFGKYRRANEAARAELLATEAAQNAVRLLLVKQVVQSYYAFVAADAQEQVLQRTLAARQEALDLDSQRFSAGVTSEFHLLQTKAEVAAAEAQHAQAVQAREQEQAALLLLVGRGPRDILLANVNHTGLGQMDVIWIPDGLPSTLLLRRPDLQESEQKLIAANARIGNIRSEVFPSVTLTGYLGSESVELSDLFSGPAGIFQLAAKLAQPIFQGGRTTHALRVTEAQYREAAVAYEKAVANAFYDVRSALAAQTGARLTLQAQKQRVDALTRAYQQAISRLEGGVASRVETLDTERQLLQAQLAEVDAGRAQRAAIADLFAALGGGWESTPTTGKSQQ